jgi:DNA-binding beta-propeller fold protein YncE
MEINRFPLSVGIAAAFLSGCGGSQTPVGASGAMPEVPSSSAKAGHCKAWMSAKGDSRNPWLYVADTLDSVIYVYELRKSGAIEIGEITEGLNGPFGEAVDSAGNLYVANQNSPGNVVIYAPGKLSPSLTLSQDLEMPQGVAVDASGDVWITNRGDNPGIAVFPPGKTEPSAYITNALIQKPIEDFFDGAGNLYFSDPSTGVSEIPSGSQRVFSLGLQGLTQATGITLAPSGNLYVGDYKNGPHVVRVYTLGELRPKHDLAGKEGSYYIADGSIGLSNDIFVGDWASPRVFIYRDGDKHWYSVIDTPGANAGGVAFKPAGVP